MTDMDLASELHPNRKIFLQTISQFWWLALLRGIILIVLGGYALLTPGMTALAFTQVIGFWIMLEGVLAIIAAIMGKTPSRLWTALRGILMVLAGIFVFAHSAIVAGVTTTTVMVVIATLAILSGILEIVAAIQDRKEIEGEGWLMLFGALMILYGVLLLMAPFYFGMLMIRILGMFAIINGISLIALSFRLRRLGSKLKDN